MTEMSHNINTFIINLFSKTFEIPMPDRLRPILYYLTVARSLTMSIQKQQ